MISILIVEDNHYKLETIKKLLIEELMISEGNITFAEDIKSAKRLLVTKTFDLLILDLVLPLEVGDTPAPEKGIGFLRDLESNPNLHPPIHIIGLTEFGDLSKQYGKDFESHVWYLINYNAIEINWQEKLKNLVYHLVATKRRFFESTKELQSFDIAIITALNKPEFEKILDLPLSWSNLPIDGDPTKYYAGELTNGGKKAKVVAACVDQMGMTATSVLVTKMIYLFKPKYFIMGGICAGLKERGLNYGDIIIAEQSWDYGSGKMKDAEESHEGIKEIVFEPDPRPIQLAASLKAKVNSFLRRRDILAKIQYESKYMKPEFVLKASIGPVATGSFVISSVSKLNEIKNVQRKLLGVEMEGYGLYYACEHSQDQAIKGIMIKSVSDFGDASKNDVYQDYSSYTSAQFIYYFILDELM